jgi:epoxyqueuosine reductase
MTIHDRIIEELAAQGLRARFASLSHIGRVKERIDGLRARGLVNESIMDQYLFWTEYGTDYFPEARSILVIARHEPLVGLCFHYQGRDIHTVIPPTYIYSESLRMTEETLASLVAPHRHTQARLPDKALAVSIGLAQYGRNNICYVEGLGSFHRLFSYYTDIPCDTDTVNSEPVMPACETCRRCLNACPTGSIREEHFTIDAGRCLTYLNENEGPFPDWVDPAWHNAIVGCMKCQAICPLNRNVVDHIERQVDFTAEETSLILDKTPWETLPEHLREKLDSLNMRGYYGVLERNLRVLMR